MTRYCEGECQVSSPQTPRPHFSMLTRLEAKFCLDRACLVAHKIYGIPQTINSANYVYFLAYQALAKIKAPDTAAIHRMVTGNQPRSFHTRNTPPRTPRNIPVLLRRCRRLLMDRLCYLATRRGAAPPAPGPGHGPVLARQFGLPDRTGIHRHGEQQNWRTVQDLNSAHDGRLARVATKVRVPPRPRPSISLPH